MKKMLCLLLTGILLLGLLPVAGAEETKTPVINCYDFDLRFHLEADTFPYRYPAPDGIQKKEPVRGGDAPPPGIHNHGIRRSSGCCPVPFFHPGNVSTETA